MMKTNHCDICNKRVIVTVIQLLDHRYFQVCRECCSDLLQKLITDKNNIDNLGNFIKKYIDKE